MGNINPFMVPDRRHSMGRLISSCVIDCAASAVNSYTGRGQLWENLEQSQTPADSDPQSSGPFYVGGSIVASTNDPTFTGQPGSEGAYWLFDGGDFFTHSGQTTAATPLVDGCWKNLHKTTGGQDFTFVITMTYSDTGAVQALFATKATGSNRGVVAFIGTGDAISFTQRGDSATVTVTSTGTLTALETYLIGVAHKASTNETSIWINSSTAEVLSHTYNGTSSEATTPLTVGVNFDNTITTPQFLFPNGTRVYDILFFNESLTDGQMATVKTELEARNGFSF